MSDAKQVVGGTDEVGRDLGTAKPAVSRATILRVGRRVECGLLDRAATSIVLNIAEGAGEFSKDEKQRFSRMARRSATETAAILDVLERRQAVTTTVIQPARDLLVRVVSMLVRLAST